MSLDEHGPQKISELALKLHMVDSNVSNICSRLEKLQFIERVRQNTDQRVVKINLTDLAKKQIFALKNEEQHFVERMSQLINPSEIKTINTGLEQLVKLLDELNKESNMEESQNES